MQSFRSIVSAWLALNLCATLTVWRGTVIGACTEQLCVQKSCYCDKWISGTQGIKYGQPYAHTYMLASAPDGDHASEVMSLRTGVSTGCACDGTCFTDGYQPGSLCQLCNNVGTITLWECRFSA